MLCRREERGPQRWPPATVQCLHTRLTRHRTRWSEGLKTFVLPQISVAGLAVMDSNLDRYPYDQERVSFAEISVSTEVPRSEMRPEITVLDGRERDKLLDNALMVRQCALMASIWGVE
ncbi:Lon protease [Gossypium arboreum]|uniref:Lon protease n=1 Tax=Gossypium arboreum TaxID=29729 RepID=A0A0B0NQL6_GOSAR|nr:Lon protease [Gossypium arboreum]